MTETAQRFARLFEKARKRIEYFVQGAIVQFTESVVLRMGELKVNRADLADRLKCKPSYITKVLRGGTNFTLESMVKIALVLDSELSVGLIPKVSVEKWGDIIQSRENVRSNASKPQIRTEFNLFQSGRGTMNLSSLPTVTSLLKSIPNEYTFSIAA